MRKLLLLAAVAAVCASPAFAQAPTPAKVTSITPGSDLVPIVPGGQPTAQQQFATVAMMRAGTSDGIVASALPLLSFKNGDGTTIAASAGAGVFGIAISAGTSEHLISEAANSNTKTDAATYEYVLPPSYVAGTDVTVTANCQYTLGSGTVGTHTLAAAAYLTAADGTAGSTLIATSAQTVPAAAGNVSFTITGTSLVPGSRLLLKFTLVIQDTGASNITAQINSVTLS